MLVGFGRVGSRVAEVLKARDIPFVVAEQNREQVEALRKQGIAAVAGNAAEPAVLIQAHIANAAMLVIASPDPVDIRQMADTARKLNPRIEIVLRTYNAAEAQLLTKDGIGKVFFSEDELAKSITSHITTRFAPNENEH